MGKGPDRAGQLSDAHRFGGFLESSALSHDFVMEERKLQSESGWFGVNTMSPSDDDCRLEFVCPSFEHIE